jgi:hypothetical protein
MTRRMQKPESFVADLRDANPKDPAGPVPSGLLPPRAEAATRSCCPQHVVARGRREGGPRLATR